MIATAEVIGIDKNMVTLHIEARDEMDVISRGTHVRAIIDMQRFLKRVDANRPVAVSSAKARRLTG